MAQIMAPLKYISNFGETLEIPFINCKINFFSNWTANCVITFCDKYQAKTFAKTDTKLYFSIVSLSKEDTSELLQQLKSGFKRTTNCDKYQSKGITQLRKQYLVYIIEPSFQGVNKPFFIM